MHSIVVTFKELDTPKSYFDEVLRRKRTNVFSIFKINLDENCLLIKINDVPSKVLDCLEVLFVRITD